MQPMFNKQESELGIVEKLISEFSDKNVIFTRNLGLKPRRSTTALSFVALSKSPLQNCTSDFRLPTSLNNLFITIARWFDFRTIPQAKRVLSNQLSKISGKSI